MGLQEDISHLFPTTQQQQEGNTGQRFLGGTSVTPSPVRQPDTQPAARPGTLARATESFAKIPSMEALTSQMGGGNPPAPPMDPDSADPTGPSSGPQGPPNELVEGVLGIFDFISRIFLAPKYLGQVIDPNTGVVKRPQLPGTGFPTASDWLPHLAIFDIPALLPSSIKAGKIWADTGVNPLQQMSQAFDPKFANAEEAMWAAQPADVRGTQRATEELVKAPATLIAAAGQAVLGDNWAPTLDNALKLDALTYALPIAGAIPSAAAKYVSLGRTAKDAIAGQPGLPDQIGMAMRDAYFEGAADPKKGSTMWAAADSLVDPAWAFIPYGKIGNFMRTGALTVSKLPVVRPLVNGTARTLAPIGEWLGTNWFATTANSQAHLMGEGSHNLIKKMADLNGADLTNGRDAGPFLTAFRDILDDGLAKMPNREVWLKDNPGAKEMLAANELLLRYNHPDYKVLNKGLAKTIEEVAAVPQTPKGQPNIGLMTRAGLFAEQQGFSAEQFVDHIQALTRVLYLAEHPPKQATSIIGKIVEEIGRANRVASSYIKPLLLAHPVYTVNNVSENTARSVQQYGFVDRSAAYALAKAEGRLPETTGELGIMASLVPAPDAKATLASAYNKVGYNVVLDEIGLQLDIGPSGKLLTRTTLLPTPLAKIPLFEDWARFNQNVERGLHQATFEVAFHQALPKQLDTLFEATGSKALAARLRGSAGLEQMLDRLGIGRGRYKGVGAHIDYALMDQADASLLKHHMDTLSRGGKIPDGEMVNQAFLQMTADVATKQGIEMEAAILHKPFAGIADHVEAYKRILPDGVSDLQRQLSDEVLQQGALLENTTRDFALADSRLADLRKIQIMAEDATQEVKNLRAAWAIKTDGTYTEVFRVAESLHRQLAQRNKDFNWAVYAADDGTGGLRKLRYQRNGEVNQVVNGRINRLWEAHYQTYKNINGTMLKVQESLRNIYIEDLYKESVSKGAKAWTDKGFETKLKKVVRDALHQPHDYKAIEHGAIGFPDPANIRVTPLSAKAAAWYKQQEITIRGSHITGAIDDATLTRLIDQVGLPKDINPNLPEDPIARVTEAHAAQNAKILAAQESFNAKMADGGPPDISKLGARFSHDATGEPIDLQKFISDARATHSKAADIADLESKRLNFDYAGGQRNIDQFFNQFYPFHFWPSRYMAWQIKWAAKNPGQALRGLEVLKSWYDGNKERPWFDKFSVHYANVNPGTKDAYEARFSPLSLLLPLGFMAIDAAHTLDPQKEADLGDLAQLMASNMGGMFHPWITMAAGTVGLSLDGRAPKSVEDQLKTVLPQTNLLRQGAAAAIPGSLSLLTKAEADKVIRSITDDATLGVVSKGDAVIAATSIAQGKPNPLALEYLKQESPARFAGSVFRQFISGGGGVTLGQKATDTAWRALNESRTAGERALVYQAAPGMGIGIAGKTGDAQKLGILYANAPEDPTFRSMYFAQHREVLKGLQESVEKEQAAKGTPDWKLRAATPESWDAFRNGGGAFITPQLVDYWIRGVNLPTSAEDKLREMYKVYGMGALTYQDWKTRILPDAYYQWVAERRSQINSGRLTTTK